MILINNSMKMIFNVSLKSLFLSNTRSPNPAFASNPLITAPNEIVPLINIIVSPIEIAQFGIKPINDANIGCNSLPPFIKLVTSIFVSE